MHKVFVTYHHENDQRYKEELVALGERNSIFIDQSVDTGDISDDLSDEYIRELIRDRYLRDSTVTIVLVGTQTKGRKHVDWEIYSSMYDGPINKKSGILVIELPEVSRDYFTAPHGEQEKKLYGAVTWTSVDSRTEYERRYPYMPARIVDNLLEAKALVSVVPWNRLNENILDQLIETAYRDRAKCQYNLSRPMRRANS